MCSKSNELRDGFRQSLALRQNGDGIVFAKQDRTMYHGIWNDQDETATTRSMVDAERCFEISKHLEPHHRLQEEQQEQQEQQELQPQGQPSAEQQEQHPHSQHPSL